MVVSVEDRAEYARIRHARLMHKLSSLLAVLRQYLRWSHDGFTSNLILVYSRKNRLPHGSLKVLGSYQLSCLSLAPRTIVRPPSCHHNPPDRCLAAAAGKPCAQVDAVLQLEEAAHPVGVHIIRDRRTAQPDSVLQHLNQSQPQLFQFRLGQLSAPAPRPDAGAKQALVGVDVSHPGEQLLVKQRRLDEQLAPAEKPGKLRLRYYQGIGARSAKAFSDRKSGA